MKITVPNNWSKKEVWSTLSEKQKEHCRAKRRDAQRACYARKKGIDMNPKPKVIEKDLAAARKRNKNRLDKKKALKKEQVSKEQLLLKERERQRVEKRMEKERKMTKAGYTAEREASGVNNYPLEFQVALCLYKLYTGSTSLKTIPEEVVEAAGITYNKDTMIYPTLKDLRIKFKHKCRTVGKMHGNCRRPYHDPTTDI